MVLALGGIPFFMPGRINDPGIICQRLNEKLKKMSQNYSFDFLLGYNYS
jgi:hypothetical protein